MILLEKLTLREFVAGTAFIFAVCGWLLNVQWSTDANARQIKENKVKIEAIYELKTELAFISGILSEKYNIKLPKKKDKKQ